MSFPQSLISSYSYLCLFLQVYDQSLTEQKPPENEEDYLNALSSHSTNRQKLASVIASMKSLTAKEAFIHSLRFVVQWLDLPS